MISFKLRPPKTEDSSFIYSSWLKSYRNSNYAKDQCNAVFFENHKKVINSILDKSMMVVVCSQEDDNHVFGYTIYEYLAGDNLLIHYTYIKHTYRKMGIAKKMIQSIRKSQNPILSSHYTSICKIIKNHIIIYDPSRMYNFVDIN